MNIFITNTTASPIKIDDLGVIIVADATIDLLDYCSLSEIYESDVLNALIISTSIEVLHEGQPLSIADALDHVTGETKFLDEQLPDGFPTGGITGQLLGKISNNDYEIGQINANNHVHPISAITDLQTTLNNKADTTTVQDALNLKSDSTHTHSEYLEDAPSDGNEYLRKDGSQAQPSSIGATQLIDLSDVSTAAVTNRYALIANGSQYIGRLLVEADISDLGSYITVSSVTYANLNNNGSVGTSSTQVARGDHNHNSIYIGDAPSDGNEYVRKNQTQTINSGGSFDFTGGGISMVWAEENAAFSPTTDGGLQFSQGNGATGNLGLVIPYNCSIIGLTLSSSSAATGTVELEINGVATGSTISLSAETDSITTGLLHSITSGDYINFRTTSGSDGADIIVGCALQTNGVVGDKGDPGDVGVGVPIGGTTGQVLAKATNTDYDTEWVDQGSGGGATQLTDLTDVNTANVTNRYVLVADGVDYESRLLTEADISDLGSYITISSVNYTNLNNNGSVGTGSTQVARGDHLHSGVYAPTSHSHTESEITDLGSYITVSGVTYANLNNNGSVGTSSTQVARGDHNHNTSYIGEAPNDTNQYIRYQNGWITLGSSTLHVYSFTSLVGNDVDRPLKAMSMYNHMHDTTTPHADAGYIKSTNVTYANLNTNGSVGTSSTQVARGDHNHSGVYEPANTNIQLHISNTSNPHSVTSTQVLPSQTGNSGKVLTTNGTVASQATPTGGSAAIPYFCAIKSGTQNIASTTYVTITTFTTSVIDTNTFSFNTSTGIVTILVAGIYRLDYNLSATAAADTDMDCALGLNGTTAINGTYGGIGFGKFPPAHGGAAASLIMSLSVNDTIRMLSARTGTGTLVLQAEGTQFNIIKIA